MEIRKELGERNDAYERPTVEDLGTLGEMTQGPLGGVAEGNGTMS